MPDEENIITLVEEDGKERDYAIDEIVEIDDAKYAVLIPVECFEEDEEEICEEAIIMKYEVDEKGDEYLSDIEDDEEYERVIEALEAFEEDDYDDYDDEDEDEDDDDDEEEF